MDTITFPFHNLNQDRFARLSYVHLIGFLDALNIQGLERASAIAFHGDLQAATQQQQQDKDPQADFKVPAQMDQLTAKVQQLALQVKERQDADLEIENRMRFKLKLERDIIWTSYTRAEIAKKAGISDCSNEHPQPYSGHLNFKYEPQRQSREENLQNYWNDTFIPQINQLLKSKNRTLIDIHSNPLAGMQKRSPDIGLFENSQKFLFRCYCFIELKNGNGDFSNEDIGQLIEYSQIVLQTQPYRPRFYIALCNYSFLYILKTERGEHGGLTYKKMFEGELNYSLNIFLGLLTLTDLEFGVKIPTISGVKLTGFLGRGASVDAYEGEYENSKVVVKFFNGRSDLVDQPQYFAEKYALQKLSANAIDGVPKLKEARDKDCVLIESPVGIPFVDSITPSQFKSFVDTLFAAHNIGFVHRDICHKNYFMVNTGSLLNDWGASYNKFYDPVKNISRGDSEAVQYFGVGLECCKELCKMKRDSYIPQAKHDIHALARSVFILHNKERIHELLFEKNGDLDYDKIDRFWDGIAEVSPLWKSIFLAADNIQVGKLGTYVAFSDLVCQYLNTLCVYQTAEFFKLLSKN